MVFQYAFCFLSIFSLTRQMFAFAASIWVALMSSLAIAQDQVTRFEVGDLIEFEFHGEKQQQVVLELVGGGWCRVEADFVGRKVPHTVVPDRATLIRRANAQDFPEEYRTWTDATGKFKVEATIFELTETEVKLLKKDEKVVTIPLEKLSEADRAHLAEVRAKIAAEVNPFEGGTPVRPGQPTGGVDSFSGMLPQNDPEPAPQVFENGALPIEGQSVRPANEIALDSSEFSYIPAQQPSHIADKSVALPSSKFSSDYQAHTSSRLFYSGNSGELIAIYRNNPFQNFSQAILVDTNTEEVFGDFTLPFKEVNDVVVSPSKQSVVTIHNPFGNDGGGLVFWKPGNDQLVPEKAWKFENFLQQNRFTAHSSLFVDDQHLFTVGSHLALWDLEDDECIYSVSNPGAWVISRDNSHIVFFQKGSLWIMRLKDGAVVGRIQGDPNFMASLRVLEISPDGRSLVASSGGALHGFDLTNGQSLFSFDTGYAINSVLWADNSLLLVNGGRIVDPKLQVVVWNFSLSPGLYRAQTGSTTWIVAPDRVFGLELINENRRREIEKNTKDLTAQELLMFGPGSRVSLAVELNHLGNESDAVSDALRQRLEQLGFVIDDKAPLRLEAVVLRGDEVQEVVRDHFGSRFGPVQERIRYTPHTSHLMLKRDKEVLWKVSANYSASGPILHMERNETPQDAATRLCKPNAAFFTSASIPSKISRLPKDRPLGNSQITAAGLQ
ncbi:MAG: SHD1 domain-containing protein [Pirellulaceae bacterium]|nr:SHD1 domain-containing protein [Pirellulaceae bacterium]